MADQDALIRPEEQPEVSFVTRPRRFVMHRVTHQELRELSSIHHSAALALFTLSAGSLLTLVVAMFVTPPDKPLIIAAFVGAIIGLAGLSLLCGAFAIRAWLNTGALIRDITERPTE